MSWLMFAFAGPILWAISTHFDKYLVERYFKHASVAVLLVFTALTGLMLLPPIWLMRPDVVDIAPAEILVIALAGLLYMGGLYFYLQALQAEEASVVAPFFQASPLIAYGLGYLVLGERLTAMQLAGGGAIVAASVLVSVRPGAARGFKARLVVLMLCCALALSLSSLIFKIFAVRDDFWTTAFWSFVGQAAFGAVILAIPGQRAQFLALMRHNTGALIAINGANELINLGGGLGARFALTLAPLSLVQAVTSTTSLFVFGFGVALSLLFPALGREDLSAHNLLTKGIAAGLVMIGVRLITG
jgi:uncharacterized membrane protein